MDMETIIIDRNMVHVILCAFRAASADGLSSLNAHGKPLKDHLPAKDFADAETRVIRTLNSVYPDIVRQYFDVNNA